MPPHSQDLKAMNSTNGVVHSELESLFSEGDKNVAIRIFKKPGQIWSLEIADEFDNRSTYETSFESEEEAYAEALDLLKT